MAYKPQSGSNIVGTFPAGAYTAPAPSEITGQFPLVVSVARRLVRATTGSWLPCSPLANERRAVHASARWQPVLRRAAWQNSTPRQAATTPGWGQSHVLDPASRRAGWGAYGRLLARSTVPGWVVTRPLDYFDRARWGAYGPLARVSPLLPWIGSVAADPVRNGRWSGNTIAAWRAVPYVYPSPALVDISVVGGGITAAFAGIYSPPAGNAIAGSFPAGTYTAPPLIYPGTSDMQLPYRAAQITVGAALEQVMDGSGNPLLTTGRINPHRIARWGKSIARSRDQDHPWTRYSRPLNPGWGIVVPPGQVDPDPGEQIIIPIRSAYIVVNETLLVRADDTTPINASPLSIGFDCDSWLPSFSANIPYSQRDAVMPDASPVELLAYINGAEFRLLVEKVSTTRQFGQRSIAISGRGIACELASPYATPGQRANASPMTAQQLIDAALEYTGYSQSWGITDWSVPAGVLNLSGTAIDVAQHVADAAGAVLQAAWATKTLRMLPRYPVKPWEWSTATPDIIIPAAITETESIEWSEKPDYNLVYVAGELAGITGQVKITGTAGDKPAPMVTHPLITHADAARQRGISILSDTGRRAIMQISLPVLPESGVIDICRLVEFTDGSTTRRGITRANTITAGFPTLRQTLTIEAAP